HLHVPLPLRHHFERLPAIVESGRPAPRRSPWARHNPSDDSLAKLTLAPLNIERKTTPRAQPLHTPRGPRTRQRRQQIDPPGITLHEHLRDPRSATEIPVDLKRRM